MVKSERQHEFDWLRYLAPEFRVDGNKIEILETPGQFHEKLKISAKNAKKRIVLAALYLGTGTLEKELLDSVQDAARRSNNDIKVEVLLDYVRGSRGEKNSKTMLKPLISQFSGSDNLSIALYHTPNLRGVLKKYLPPRWNETIGVAHLKVFIFDDLFIISGANLSNDYFTHRQDRYVAFHDCPQLANYFHQIVTTVSQFSFTLLPNDKVELNPKWRHHPYDGDIDSFVKEAHVDVRSLIQSSISPEGRQKFLDPPQQPTRNQKLGHFNKLIYYPWSFFKTVGNATLNFVGVPTSGPEDFSEKNLSPKEVNGMQNHQLIDDNPEGVTDKNLDTWIYPTIQMGLFGIQQDEVVTESLMKSFPKGSTVSFTTGYFNVTDKYCNVMVQNNANYNILLSSPEANGFFGSRGFGGYIPAVYVHLCKKFYDKVLAFGRGDDFTLFEYIRNGWTFHGKGMWCYLPGQKLPTMSLIGSPNFGLRSVNRDLEAQVVIVTKNEKLRRKLHEEQKKLMAHTQKVTAETFQHPRYHVPRWVALVTFFIKRYF